MLLAVAFALVVGPAGAAFYAPPSPLPAGVDGRVIWARSFTGGSALPSAAHNERVLYETVGASGNFVAVSGTVAIPRGTPPAQGWPVISWAHGTVGDAPQCAPSRMDSPDIEQRMLDTFVRRGFVVAQTDYEGNGTPGIHPYFVATASARDVTDIVRAARELDPHVGRTWVAMGHSEGGAAALATAALGQRWAPELRLVGAVAYAPGSHLETILQNELLNPDPNGGLVFLGLLLAGYSTVDPRVDPAQILRPEVVRMMPELQQRCVDDLMRDSDWAHVTPSAIFRPQADLQPFYDDLIANDPENFSFSTPTLVVQGVSDPLIPSAMTIALCERLRRNGVPVTLKTYTSATHGTVLLQSENDVAAWVAERFAPR